MAPDYDDLTLFGKMLRHVKAVAITILALPFIFIGVWFVEARRVFRKLTIKNPNA